MSYVEIPSQIWQETSNLCKPSMYKSFVILFDTDTTQLWEFKQSAVVSLAAKTDRMHIEIQNKAH